MACAALACAEVATAQEAPGVVTEVRVHGNHTTPDADVLAIIGNVVDRPATDALVAEVTARIEASGRFDDVDVRRRFRSIDDPDDILLVVVVDEKPGISEANLTPGPLKRFASSGMFLPVLGYIDGHGFTYGARMSFVDRMGAGSRISMPFTWGGERQARVQLEKTFARARLAGDAGIGRRQNPHYELGDTREGGHVRTEGVLQRWLRVGASAGREDVRFGDARDTLTRAGADVTLDTRVDPAFPRNAVHAVVGWERLSFDAGNAVRRTADLRGYVGLVGQSVLAIRGLSVSSNRPLPRYEQSLLGGASNLRGHDAGYRASDSLAAVSAEIRLPITSPLSIGRFGLKAFADAGASYAAGAKIGDQRLEASYGAGLYMHLTVLSLSLDVAWPERGGGPNLHFGMGVAIR